MTTAQLPLNARISDARRTPRDRVCREQALDALLVETFPASDPLPAFWSGPVDAKSAETRSTPAEKRDQEKPVEQLVGEGFTPHRGGSSGPNESTPLTVSL